MENAYAQQAKLTVTQLQNRDGQWIKPSHKAFEATAQAANWNVPDFAVNLINQPGPATWPIVSPTFILLPKDPQDAERSRTVMRFFDWAYRNGDASAESLDYVPLPEAVKGRVREAWVSQVRGPNGQPVWK